MKIKIKEMAGRPVVPGFFPRAGVKILPSRRRRNEDGQWVDVPADVYECETEDEFHTCLETGLVEAVIERKRPGRPKKPEADETH